MTPSRRDVLKFGAFGAGMVLLPRVSFLGAAEPDADPHFFLLIVLNGGADSSYMFDARPLSMTKAGRIQNYLGEEPAPWVGRNGVSALATSLIKPLAAFRDQFSVINGVYMAPSFDGHLQNMNFLFAGKPFGGDSFVPHLNLPETGRKPESLDAIVPTAPLFINVDNHSGVVPLQPRSVAGLSARLKQFEAPRSGDATVDFMRSRLAANAVEPGRFSAGSSLMLAGLEGAPRVHHKLARLTAPKREESAERQSLALIAECFRLSISRSAIYVLPEAFDVHAPDQALAQPKLFGSAIGRITDLLNGLRETAFDAKRSIFDVTTVMIASELGRTLRAPDMPIGATGTNHNQFSNSILIGGKGIRGGMVIGASDLPDERATVSKAHLALDPVLEKAMGRPFDFAALKPRPDHPDAFDIKDYLTVGSVVNTIYALFGVPKAHYRMLRPDLPLAPVLHGLLA
ncbi:MAG: DUF1501 domain-containing protein [Hyphomicrobiaceae bacterium]|nr:MAG: DUF1501 domain-containing protein [Hyphomicrobiaceae bacterium]